MVFQMEGKGMLVIVLLIIWHEKLNFKFIWLEEMK
jgi:hypothetical protein